MLTQLLERLSKVINVKEAVGDVIVPDAMSYAHYKDTLVGVWWYHIVDGRLEYSEEATTHQDFDRFTAPENSRGWVRGRVFRYEKRGFVVVYLEDWTYHSIPGRIISDIVAKISRESTIPIVGVVDEEGHSLLED